MICNILCCIFWCIKRSREPERSTLRTDGPKVIPAGIPVGIQVDPSLVDDEPKEERPITGGNNSVENGNYIEYV